VSGLAWVEISEELLRQVLHAPNDCKIVGADFKYAHIVRLLFSSPELPDVEDIPTVLPTVTRKPEEYIWQWQPAWRQPGRGYGR